MADKDSPGESAEALLLTKEEGSAEGMIHCRGSAVVHTMKCMSAWLGHE